MTANDLLEKLHECRDNMENSKDDLDQTTFDTLNALISEIEDCGIENNDSFNSGRRVFHGGY